jgi:hypothetical protein
MKLLRFVADGMLGKLTRWLRMLGHDVEYAGSMDDRQLILKAKEENRILLTRDVELFKRATARGVEAFLAENPTQTANLVGLAKRFRFKLEIDVTVSRCPKCNSKLKPIDKTSVADKLFEATVSNYDEFWQCEGCGQLYWRGTHWKKIEKTLRQAEEGMKS